MKNKGKGIIKVNTKALAAFDKTLDLANQLAEDGAHHPAEWFDTPEKRLQWWLDLEPQWRKAFNEAIFMQKRQKRGATYQPNDRELEHLFSQKALYICGSGQFQHRNNNPDISFQLTNLTGIKNLTKLTRIECDFNGQIESLEPLKYLNKLSTLWMDNNKVSDLSPLMELQNLRSLCCWNNQITSIEPLAAMPNLTDIVLGLYGVGNPLENIDPLKYLLNLRSLYIDGCNVTTLEPLRKCTGLNVLSAIQNDIASLEPIEHLNLWAKYFRGNPRLRKH